MTAPRKVLVVQVAALGRGLLAAHGRATLADLPVRAAASVLPALTCTVQATLRTAASPAAHGMVANGVFERRLRKPFFWEQAATLVDGPRIWDAYRGRGGRVGLLFWQQSLGEAADVVLSPAPIHKHHGGMVEACYSQPAGLYDRLAAAVGRPFRLRHYWGPLASVASSAWIADATAALLDLPDAAPDCCFTYLPGLDYDLQRHGPASPQADRALLAVCGQIQQLAAAAARLHYELLVFGDYAIAPCPGGAVYPNRALAAAGLLVTRLVDGRCYADLHASRAFALCDHELAHVYLRDPAAAAAAAGALAGLPGVGRVLARDAQSAAGLAHAHSGELVLEAAEGHWFSYRYWPADARAPDYAGHVDIHQKPGYDPCELFFGWPPGSVSQDDSRIRGSHGRVGPGREVAVAASFDLGSPAPTSLIELAISLRTWLNGGHER